MAEDRRAVEYPSTLSFSDNGSNIGVQTHDVELAFVAI
ncbi:MAG: hypothetical protein ACI8PG_003258 [Planctomycetota bacterium]|jgi:hypothetical protein